MQLVHAVGGGAGGFGSKLLTQLLENYTTKTTFNFSLFPNPSFGYNSAVEPYNTTLAMHYLIENLTSTVCVDEGVEWRRVKEGNPSRDGLQRLVGTMMSHVSACQRFTGPV
jgi:hypothetical protein